MAAACSPIDNEDGITATIDRDVAEIDLEEVEDGTNDDETTKLMDTTAT